MQQPKIDIDQIDILVAVFVTMLVIGIIWEIANYVGVVSPPVWLLIIGIIGFLGVWLFIQIRERK